MAETLEPFSVALRDLMDLFDISFRQLAKYTGDHRDKPYAVSRLQQLAAGAGNPPTPQAIEVIARSLGVDPRYFREYREHVARQAAVQAVRRGGLDAVLDALDSVQ